MMTQPDTTHSTPNSPYALIVFCVAVVLFLLSFYYLIGVWLIGFAAILTVFVIVVIGLFLVLSPKTSISPK